MNGKRAKYIRRQTKKAVLIHLKQRARWDELQRRAEPPSFWQRVKMALRRWRQA